MIKYICRFVFALLFTLAPAAHAIVEVRGHLGFDLVSPDAFNDFLSSQDVKQIYLYPRKGLSAYFRPFGPGLLIGAQLDWHSIKVNSSNNSTTGNAELQTRTLAAKAIYHLTTERFRNGPAATLGFGNDFSLTGRNSSNVMFAYGDADDLSLAAGWEIGWRLKRIAFGMEVGYQWRKIKSVSGPAGDASFAKIDLSGPYNLFFFGVGFD